MNKKTLGIILVIVALSTFASSIYGVISSLTIHEQGRISMVKAYSDSGATVEVKDIDWGEPQPGETLNQTIYLKNFGGSPVTLTMTVENWNPSNAVNYMKLGWNREGESIDAGLTLQATLTLTVFENITESSIGTFSFDRVFNEEW